jgi:hypothetical protein
VQAVSEPFEGPVVRADFFFDPQSAPKELPHWAGSPFEFVYIARRLLESRKIRAILHQWIDVVFGVHSLSGRVFTKPHPPAPDFPLFERRKFSVRLKRRVLWLVALSVTPERASYGFLFDNFEIVTVHIDVRSKEVFNITAAGSIDCSPGDDLTFIPHRFFLVFSRSRSALIAVRENNSNIIPFFTETNLFVAYRGSTIFCPDSGCVCHCRFRREGREVTPICFVDGSICALDANPAFRIVALATTDGTIQLFDFETGGELGRYESGREIYAVSVSSLWGYVLAVAKDALFLFSPNGELIKTTHPEVPISRVFPHYSRSGHDFWSFVNERNQIWLFEAFYPERMWVLAQEPPEAEVIRISHSPFQGWFLIAFASGVVEMLPPEDMFLSPYS